MSRDIADYAIAYDDYFEGMARVRAYQRALGMADWTLFAPLDYRRWAGRATHFRDAERSEAVAGDGDPLGLVDPLAGEPMRQEVSAERPVWTGEGIYFGGNDSLNFSVDTPSSLSIIMGWQMDDYDGNIRNVIRTNQTNNSALQIRTRADVRMQMTARDESDAQFLNNNFLDAETADYREWNGLGLSISIDESDNVTFLRTVSQHEEETNTEPSQGFMIDTFILGDGIKGTLTSLAFIDSALTADEMRAVSALMRPA